MNIIDVDQLNKINGKWCLNKTPYTGIGKTYGATYYYKDGNIHRDNDLPAIEYSDGDKSWCMNGKLHRDNGLPAKEYTDGTKSWWVNGNLHRDNGLPAIEHADGRKTWWVNGKPIYSWEQYQKATKCSKEELVMYILTHGNIS